MSPRALRGLAPARTGVEALRLNPLRTGLATLGVVIGVASVVAILSLGDGMERFARDQVARTTGVQTVVIASRTTREVDGLSLPNAGYPVFSAADAAHAAREIPGVAAFALATNGRALFTVPEGRRRHAATVRATLAGAVDFERLDLSAGRFYTAPEVGRGARVVVLSHGLAEALAGPRGAESMVGRELRAGGTPLRVLGVLAAPEVGEDAAFAYVPLGSAREVMLASPEPLVPVLSLQARRVEEVETLRARAEDWLATRYGAWEDRVRVVTSQQRLQQVREGMLLFKVVMGTIAGISLLVGGIGIMNVLLASVAERTREIGIRKAVGARHRDVLVQFLAESIAIAGVGSAAGVVLGIGGAFGITAVLRALYGQPMYAGLSWSTPVFAIATAMLVGLSFGTYPALRAARLSPIDAIRHE